MPEYNFTVKTRASLEKGLFQDMSGNMQAETG